MTIAKRIDALILDRISTITNHALALEAEDPELSHWTLMHIANFAQTLDDMPDDEAILWMLPITPNQIKPMPFTYDPFNNPNLRGGSQTNHNSPEFLARTRTVDELLDERKALKTEGKPYAHIDKALVLKQV